MLKWLMKEVHQSWLVVALCAGVVVGTILGLNLRLNYFDSLVWVGVVGVLFVLAYLVPRAFWVLIMVIGGMILALVRISGELDGQDYIQQFYGQAVVITGEVEGDPETDEKGTKIKLKNLQFGEHELHATRGTIFISARQNEKIRRADTVMVQGKLSTGFGVYAGYMYKPSIVRIKHPEPGNWVLNIRDWFAGRVKSLMPEPMVNLGLSYLLGMRAGLPKDLSDNLRVVGLVHIVVASGAHLSILVEIARRIFGRLSRFAGVLFSAILIVFFMAMVGFTPSIMRAGVMALLTLMAWWVGREFAAWRIILLVAAGTLLYNPMYIINLGWLLSFASFAGIMILGPRMAKVFYGEKEPKFVASIMITTIAATLMTMPIILYFYGQISIISLAANLLILPTLPYAMGLVFLTGVVAGLPFVETAAAFLTTKLLEFHILVVEWFGEMKSFLIAIEPGKWQVFLIYAVIFVPLLIRLLWQKMIKSKQVFDIKIMGE